MGFMHKHTMVVESASTCPKCGKTDFRRLKCSDNTCGDVQTDMGTCPGHQPTKTKSR